MNNTCAILNELVNMAREKRLPFSLTSDSNGGPFKLHIGDQSYHFWQDLITEETLLRALRLISERLGETK